MKKQEKIKVGRKDPTFTAKEQGQQQPGSCSAIAISAREA
jgi:hypothetical protein